MADDNKKFMITGSSGFVGFHVASRLLSEGHKVLGLDNISDYYSPKLKEDRNEVLLKNENFEFKKLDIEDFKLVEKSFNRFKPDFVIHLAAQAGVRYSLQNPRKYLNANISGTFNILEASKIHGCKHLLMASSSSVYGGNQAIPFCENDRADFPLSFYAATKKCAESMAHSYSHLFDLPITNFRFFTVYGPWGRPDMALFKFTESIIKSKPIKLHNFGEMKRDFTYIEDLVECISRLIFLSPKSCNDNILHSSSNVAPWRVVNIGNSSPISLKIFVEELERVIGKKAKKVFVEKINGEAIETYSDVTLLRQLIGYSPTTCIADGLNKYFQWYKTYFKLDI